MPKTICSGSEKFSFKTNGQVTAIEADQTAIKR
jgi:hypothetical protein